MTTSLRHLLPALQQLAGSPEPVPLADVAELVNLSPGRTQRVFSQIVGESPKQYQLRLRLNTGARMLAGSDDRIIDVAIACGFESHEAFTRAFRRQFGEAPSRYRIRVARSQPMIPSVAWHTGPCIRLYRKGLDGPQTRERTMEYVVEQKDLEAMPILAIVRRTEVAAIGETLAELLPKVFGYVMEHGLEMACPPLVRYLEASPAFVTVEAGIGLAEPAPTAPDRDDIVASTLPAGPAAVTVHKGPYDALVNAHAALDRWIDSNNATSAGPAWEVYITDPGEVPDPADWITEVVWPLAARP